jgi:hypothetical protein
MKSIAHPAHAAAGSLPFAPGKALLIGVIALVITALGLVFSPPSLLAQSWLVGITFWTAIALGMLFLVMIHHIFDAGWSTVIRRPLEHSLSVFPVLALLFLPLIIGSLFYPGLLWKWMDTQNEAVGGDVLYWTKQGFLNVPFFIVRNVIYFGVWTWLAMRLRRASFAQDLDGSAGHTLTNRKTAAFGLIIGALTLTFASIDWIKSMDYHWFSTMFGVWFFSGSMRAALAATVLLCLFLVRTGHLKGIFKQAHLYDLGKIIFAFTVFWAYISFSQYFLIWNANIPEETFWYNVRESGQWWSVGLLLVFGHFVVPFIYLLFYKNKVTPSRMVFISCWILLIQLIDFCYNILPTKFNAATGMPVQLIRFESIWDLTSLVAVGGISLWAVGASFAKARLIPIRDPRIAESINHHE